MDDITKTFHKLMDQLNEQTKKAPEQDPELHGYDELIEAHKKLISSCHAYEAYRLFAKKKY